MKQLLRAHATLSPTEWDDPVGYAIRGSILLLLKALARQPDILRILLAYKLPPRLLVIINDA